MTRPTVALTPAARAIRLRPWTAPNDARALTQETNMPTPWRRTLHLGDIFNNEDIPQPDRMKQIAARYARFVSNDTDEYPRELAEELTDAAAEGDVKWFNAVWGAVYDWADDTRVWINTFAKAPS